MARQQQKGAALILVLAIVAMVCAVASEMLFRQSLMIRMASASVSSGQAWSYMLGGEAWVTRMLVDDWRQSKASEKYVDHLGEAWAKPIQDFPVENGNMVIVVEDLQARLDLNRALSGEQGELQRINNLLAMFNIDQSYVERLISWKKAVGSIDETSEEKSALSATNANGSILIKDTSEFLNVGMSVPEYNKIEPYIVALPAGASGLNVNTASERALACLSAGSNAEVASASMERRKDNGYSQLSDFIDSVPANDSSLFVGGLTTSSEYYRATFQIRWEGYNRAMSSIYHRDAKGNVRVIGRELYQPTAIAMPGINGRVL